MRVKQFLRICILDLISTLLSLSAVHLPLRTLTTSLTQLRVYLEKFRNRLTTDHFLHLKRLVGLLEGLEKYAEEWKSKISVAPSQGAKDKGQPVEVMTSGELLTRLGRGVEGINLLEVEGYLRESRVQVPSVNCATVLHTEAISILQVARKVSGYCVKELEKDAGQGM